MSADAPTTARGLTPREVAARLRVSPARVRGWVVRGELRAVNTADGTLAKPRYVIPPEALAAFEAKRSAAVAAPAKPARRPKRRANEVDFFPD